MRISVNLATRPFVELRSFFMRLRILMAVLVVVGVAIGFVTHSMQKKLAVAQKQMVHLQMQTSVAQAEKRHNEDRMRQPANAQVLERARFLNALFLEKSFSWTAVMMDLENVLPMGVQVTSIEPQINHEGDVLIHLRVSGDRDRTVQLVRNLERSKRFRNPHINSESSQVKQENGAPIAPAAPNAPWGVTFEILADYVPLPENMQYVQVKKDDAGAEKKTVAHTPIRAGKHARRNGIVLKPFVAPKPAVTTKLRGGAR